MKKMNSTSFVFKVWKTRKLQKAFGTKKKKKKKKFKETQKSIGRSLLFKE